jgi:hypothetical protein
MSASSSTGSSAVSAVGLARGAHAGGVVPTERDPLFESPATLDLFDLGRRAAAVRDARFAGAASFVRARRWLPGEEGSTSSRSTAATAGTWRGPRDACESYVELADLVGLPQLESWERAASAGAELMVGTVAGELHGAVIARGGRVLYRFPFRTGEPAGERRARLASLRQLVDGGAAVWGVMPTPVGEAEGIDTLRVVAALRLDLPSVPHVVLDVAALGPRLGQMALGFGGDELWAPIVSERALRLGGNANNPAMTRKEAAVLIRGAGLRPRERTGPDGYTEEIA